MSFNRISKWIANEGYEEEAVSCTRSWSRHGIGKAARRVKRIRNKAAHRKAWRIIERDFTGE